MSSAEVVPVWCIVANVVAERPYGPGGREMRNGLRLFAGGAKVYVPGGYGGMGYETVTVIGHLRHGGRLGTVDVAARYLTNWKVALVYSPAVRRRIDQVGGGGRSVFARGEECRADLQRVADEFQRHTDEIQRRWARWRGWLRRLFLNGSRVRARPENGRQPFRCG